MAHYRVFLRGANFLMEVDGKSTRVGFFTTRFVQANNRDGAELLAIDLIRNDGWLNGAVSNLRSDPPTILAEVCNGLGVYIDGDDHSEQLHVFPCGIQSTGG